jgi:outer membrane immunogenic protein
VLHPTRLCVKFTYLKEIQGISKLKKLFIAATTLSGLLVFAGSASAADPVVDLSYDWTGLYIGLQGGYAAGDADHEFDNGAPSDDSNPDGVFAGIHAGYLFQRDAIVFGLEGDIEATDISGSFDNLTGIGSSGSTEINWQGSGRLRLGYATGQFLPYLTGGIAIADVDYGGGPSGGPCCGYSKTAVGYAIGAGLEYAFSDSLTARAEYRFTDFGSENGGLAPAFPTVNMPVDLSTHAIRAGVSYHF